MEQQRTVDVNYTPVQPPCGDASLPKAEWIRFRLRGGGPSPRQPGGLCNGIHVEVETPNSRKTVTAKFLQKKCHVVCRLENEEYGRPYGMLCSLAFTAPAVAGPVIATAQKKSLNTSPSASISSLWKNSRRLRAGETLLFEN